MDQRLRELGIEYDRIEAVNGLDLKDSDIYGITKSRKDRMLWYRDLTKLEIGCLLSHRKCWKKLLADNYERALVLEDDIEIADKAVEYVKNEQWIPKNIHLIQLSNLVKSENVLIRKCIKLTNIKGELVNIIKPHHIGTQAYIIDRVAADEALKITEENEAPVDELLFSMRYKFGRKYSAWMINPYVVKTNEEESTIGGQNRKPGIPGELRQLVQSITNRLYISIMRKLKGKEHKIYFSN